jgi:hypothetical protein
LSKSASFALSMAPKIRFICFTFGAVMFNCYYPQHHRHPPKTIGLREFHEWKTQSIQWMMGWKKKLLLLKFLYKYTHNCINSPEQCGVVSERENRRVGDWVCRIPPPPSLAVLKKIKEPVQEPTLNQIFIIILFSSLVISLNFDISNRYFLF